MSKLTEMLEETSDFISVSKSMWETGINQSFPLCRTASPGASGKYIKQSVGMYAFYVNNKSMYNQAF